jgi:DNA ligase (NAD+)
VIKGITISRLSGFNAKFIKDNMIGPGAVITFCRSGDVIPHILSVDTPAEEWQEPDVEWEWNETNVDAISLVSDWQVQMLRVKNFFNKLEIEGLQEATLEYLLDNEYETIQEILELTLPEWEVLVGKNGIKIYNSIRAKLADVKLWELLGAWPYFGRGFGQKRAKAITDVLGISSLYATVGQIKAVDGFDDKMANVFVQGLPEFVRFYNWLSQLDFTNITHGDIINTTGKLINKNFVFSGFRDKEWKDLIESKGGKVQDSVNKDTTYLVVKDINTTSSKIVKAKKLGVQVIPMQEVESIIYE